MRKIYTLLFFCVFCFCEAISQSIEISTYDKPCLGTTGKIPLKLTGSFNGDNSFFVQLRQHSAPVILAQVPGVLNLNGQLEFVFTDSTLTTFTNLQVRVISTSPRVESQWDNNYQVHGKGIVHLSSSAYSDTINAGEQIKLKFTMISSSDASVTLSNGTAIHLDYGYQLEKISIQQPELIYIKGASNACGAMKTSGGADIVFNPNPLKTLWAAPSRICEDGEVTIGFSSHGLQLTPQSKFRIRFVQVTEYGVIPEVVTVPAELRNNLLVTRFPKSLNLKQETRFNAQVLIDGPKIVGNDGRVELIVAPFPQLQSLNAYPSTEIGMGEQVQLGYGSDIYYGNLEVNGIPYVADGSGTIGSNKNYLRLEKTTTFIVKSIVSACGTTIPSEPKQITIHVKPGIILEPESSRQILCVGTIARIRFRTNTTLDPSTTYAVNFLLPDNSTRSFAANRAGDYLEFFIPPLNENTAKDLLYDNYRSLKIVTSNPRIESSWSYNYVIQSKPGMELDSRNVYNFETPSKVFVGYRLFGGGEYTIIDEKGEVFNHNNYLDNAWHTNIFLSENTDYKIKSISNACFTNHNLPVANFKLAVNTNPALQLTPFKSENACISDSIEVVFNKLGVFGANNVFNIQYSYGCCNFKNIATVAGSGIYKIKVPAPPAMVDHNVFFRIASTSPLLFSDAYSINLHEGRDLLVGATITDPGSQSEPKLFFEGTPLLALNTLGNPISKITYSRNDIDTTIAFRYPLSSPAIRPNLKAGDITKFVIKSLGNSCGSQEVNLTTYLKLMPYRITLNESNYFFSKFCKGGAINVPFYIDAMSNTAGATYSLQIASNRNSNFVTIFSGETKRYFATHLPADLTPGNYVIRVISSDGAISNTISVYVDGFPTAKLSTTAPQPVVLSPEIPLEGKIDFTGSNSWTVLFSNNRLVEYLNSPGGFSAYLNEGQEFSLKYVYNGCGYGTTSGKVDVRVTPKLYTSIIKYEACEQQHFQFSYELKGDADLSNDFIRFELVNLTNAKIVVLDSTKMRKSSIVVSIPKLAPNDNYELRATVRSYGLISLITSSLTTRPNVSLGGYSTINPGERASLIFRNNKNKYDNIDYVLSDGTVGNIITGGYTDSFIQVSPSITTNYNLVSVSNGCGVGQISGNAVIEVNPVSERTVTATGLSPSKTTYCFGDTIRLAYNQKGNFSPGNVMTIQISDTTGRNFRSIPTRGSASPLTFTLPTDLVTGKRYYLRVVASDAGTSSGSYRFPIAMVQKPAAKFASSAVYFEMNPEIVVLLEGGGPWSYRYSTNETSLFRTTNTPSDTIKLQQVSPVQNYRLLEVSNQCGVGTIANPSTVKVDLQVITGSQEEVFDHVSIAPNPTSDVAILKFNNAAYRKIELINLLGSIVDLKAGRFTEHRIEVRGLPSGVYLIRIEENGKKLTYKLIKQ